MQICWLYAREIDANSTGTELEIESVATAEDQNRENFLKCFFCSLLMSLSQWHILDRSKQFTVKLG